MTPKFALISDGSCDFSLAEAAQLHVTLAPFYVSFDDKTYRREAYEVGVRDFYEEMVRNPGVFPKSSMPSVDDYMTLLRPFAQAGTPVLCVCITTKFSGSYSCATAAAGLIAEEFPGCAIHVMNSRVNTVLQGELVREAVRLRDEGCTLEEAVERLERVIPTGRIIFTVGSMDYLQMGGAHCQVASVVSGALGIKPLIILKEGKSSPPASSAAGKRAKPAHRTGPPAFCGGPGGPRDLPVCGGLWLRRAGGPPFPGPACGNAQGFLRGGGGTGAADWGNHRRAYRALPHRPGPAEAGITAYIERGPRISSAALWAKEACLHMRQASSTFQLPQRLLPL